jgi:hypothetical protein
LAKGGRPRCPVSRSSPRAGRAAFAVRRARLTRRTADVRRASGAAARRGGERRSWNRRIFMRSTVTLRIDRPRSAVLPGQGDVPWLREHWPGVTGMPRARTSFSLPPPGTSRWTMALVRMSCREPIAKQKKTCRVEASRNRGTIRAQFIESGTRDVVPGNVPREPATAPHLTWAGRPVEAQPCSAADLVYTLGARTALGQTAGRRDSNQPRH